ncbi:Sphingosine-1-phosphate phosphatase 1 [Sciurus carolinensis]|uniref:Sphingosine-1-phosphate phosphatase 1 n=1 Tax=Sciurus carolinensis TaxID=30640 RepID=A0AA41MD03_SCICA|nr:Sphingosine-1-phosphate phosphatase 1 [Sciurus carolinensis]
MAVQRDRGSPVAQERPQSALSQARTSAAPLTSCRTGWRRAGPGLIAAHGLPAMQLADGRRGRAGPLEQLAALLPVLLLNGVGQRTLLHHVLLFLNLEPGRPRGSQASDHLGAGHVPGPVHQGHHLLSQPCSPTVVKLEVFYNSEYSMPSTHAMSGTAIPISVAHLMAAGSILLYRD